MTYEELKMEHLDRHPESHYFDESTLTFFGVKEKESTVFGPVPIATDYGTKECWGLKEIQHNAPKDLIEHEAYFDVETFEVVKT